ncbi:MAG TPA: hypothetical protein VNA04_13910 [Thermoanaerobaculia bacterium]|nr:hypothetical protein [Thermoanaerobaculia bacterium]
MRKALILAMAITLVVTGSLFAQGRRLVAEPNATFTPGVGIGGFGVAGAGPTTTNNDDTCDIGTAPAATLLLPYFEVNTTDRNTIFTIVNTSRDAAIAHVTLWTDWSFPVLDFNVYLTGYDVQGLSLRDIIFNGIIAPTATAGVAGTTDVGGTAGTGLSPYGGLSRQRPNVNDNFAGPAGSAAIACTNLPGSIPPALTAAIQTALINGSYVIPGLTESCTAAQRVGSTGGTDPLHPANTAVGYVTIDVANKCSLRLPTDPAYFATDILFDNVLTGDYETFDSSAASNYAGGSPLVHIRAIPEGGPAGTLAVNPDGVTAVTNLPFTFYSRYQTHAGADARLRVLDRRQPLPSQWAARYIQGGGLSTSYKVWREGVTGATGCANASLNSALTIAEIVRFDEHENFATFAGAGNVSPSTPAGTRLNEATKVPVSSAIFPPHPTTAGDVGGWMYLNLDNGAAPIVGPGVVATTTTNNPLFPDTAYAPRRPSQNWVVVSMSGTGPAAGALSVDFDATWLGNGCTPTAGQSPANAGADLIGPAPNTNP